MKALIMKDGLAEDYFKEIALEAAISQGMRKKE